MLKNIPKGSMRWARIEGNELQLELKLDNTYKWEIHTNFPDLVQPDPFGFSPGLATFKFLLTHGWKVISTSES
jgi:hypothetical protein